MLWTIIAALAADPVDAVVVCGRVFDAAQGALTGPATLVIDGGRITDVLPHTGRPAPAPRADERHDLSGATCLPGLIDLHVHLAMSAGRDAYQDPFRLNPSDLALRAAHHARLTLEAGFTTVRDLGAPDGVVIALRDAIAKGYVPGPRVLAAGKSIATDGGHADPTNGVRRGLLPDPGPPEGVIAGADEARAAIRERYQEGADWIKITATGGVLSVARSVDNPQFTEAELAALMDAARDYGFRVAAHAHGDEGARRAVAAGVTSIEHGTWLSDDTLALMRDRHAWLVPTLTAGDWVTGKSREPDWYPEVVRPKAALIAEQIRSTFQRADALGVRWAFGTDAGVFPHGENAREFSLLVAAGISPVRALQSATVWAAELLGRSDDLGRLAPGYRADLIAVAGDPLARIDLLSDVTFVMKDGVAY